jgi:hypothetical protein
MMLAQKAAPTSIIARTQTTAVITRNAAQRMVIAIIPIVAKAIAQVVHAHHRLEDMRTI